MSVREIITKAVKAKENKKFKIKCFLYPEIQPNTILGCWVINHNFSGMNQEGKVGINGAFDVNVWYSYEENSKTEVFTKRLEYKEITNINDIKDTSEIAVRCLTEPVVIATQIGIKSMKITYSLWN